MCQVEFPHEVRVQGDKDPPEPFFSILFNTFLHWIIQALLGTPYTSLIAFHTTLDVLRFITLQSHDAVLNQTSRQLAPSACVRCRMVMPLSQVHSHLPICPLSTTRTIPLNSE